MDKLILCRLCLTNSTNTSFVAVTPEIELILQKYNVVFEKRDLSNATATATITADPADSLALLTQLCELCWQKIDEFNQFYTHVENIQITYQRQFSTADGKHQIFNDASQYFAEVEKIYAEYARKMLNGTPIDEKKIAIEPFCMISVDENATVKVVGNEANRNQSSAEDAIDEKDLTLTSEIKQEELGQMNDEPNCVDVMVSSVPPPPDVLNVGENFEVHSDCDDDDDYDEEDEQSSSDDSEDDSSTETSDDEIDEAPRKTNINKKTILLSTSKPIKQEHSTAAAAKKRNDRENRSDHRRRRRAATSSTKKYGKRISVTTASVLDENNKRLLSYVQMKCDVCSDDRAFESFAEIQTHFLDTHQQTGYIICCNRKFRRIGRVLQHCTWHDNPEAFKCDTCNKCFQDNVCLRDHVTSMHIPADERRFQCDQCNRLFAKQHLLNTHLKMKHTVKEERPFVCTEGECNQRFVLPAYLRLHIEKVHNKADSRVCDVCARFFKCSKSYERHYQVEHTNIDQRVQCDLCQKWFKHLDTLKDHIRRHYAASATCKYCGRVSSNKKSLRLHIRNVHADIDSSVKTKNEFPCTVCEKIFKKKQTLREHMTLHTGEAFLYTCTFCSKTFRSSANMYAHRKRNHPREYEEKCVQAKMQKA